MTPTRTTCLFIIAVLSLHRAVAAADWSYCIAPADGQNRIYISRPFPSVGPKAETEFGDFLVKSRLSHDSIQCPRADGEAAAVVMRQHAVDVNRDWGRQIIDMHWRPLP